MRRTIFALTITLLAAQVEAQSFTLPSPENNRQPSGANLYFTLQPLPERLRFTFVPPARRMFVDQKGDLSLFPALFPSGIHFNRLVSGHPGYFAQHFQGEFTAYRVGEYYLALQEGYTLHSATIRDGRLFVLARDSDGYFVVLDASHIALARADGTPAALDEAPAMPAVISLLVDRSASIAGFTADIRGALDTVSNTLAPHDRCALYEFGEHIRVVQRPSETTCAQLLSTYRMSQASGSTPLYQTMAAAYSDLGAGESIAAVVIISDGAPTDSPHISLVAHAARIPTFVLWVGNHTEDHIARYSTSHAISRDGAREEIEDFLGAVSVSVRGHQTFTISSP